MTHGKEQLFPLDILPSKKIPLPVRNLEFGQPCTMTFWERTADEITIWKGKVIWRVHGLPGERVDDLEIQLMNLLHARNKICGTITFSGSKFFEPSAASWKILPEP